MKYFQLCRNVFTVLVFSSLATIAHSWRPYKLRLHSPAQISSSPDTMDFNITIDENSTVSFNLNIKRDQTSAFMHLTYLFADRDGNYNLVYVNKTINLCAFLTNRKIDFALGVLLTVGERFGQLPTHCPIKKKVYYVTNMRISAENLPPVMPETRGILMFKWMSKISGDFKTLLSANVSFVLEKVFKPTERTN